LTIANKPTTPKNTTFKTAVVATASTIWTINVPIQKQRSLTHPPSKNDSHTAQSMNTRSIVTQKVSGL
jgi:hypothetical protein